MFVNTPDAAELAAQLSSMAMQQPSLALPPAGSLLCPPLFSDIGAVTARPTVLSNSFRGKCSGPRDMRALTHVRNHRWLTRAAEA